MIAEVYTPRLLILYGIIILFAVRLINFLIIKKNNKYFNFKKEFTLDIFIFYLICLLSITLLPITIYYTNQPFKIIPTFNLIPIKGLFNLTSINLFMMNTLGNLILFVPFVIFINILNQKKISLLKNLIIVLMFSLSIELFQYLEMYFQVAIRMVDINDIILNVLGGGIGYYIYISLFKKISLSIKI